MGSPRVRSPRPDAETGTSLDHFGPSARVDSLLRQRSPEAPLVGAAAVDGTIPGGWCEVYTPACGHSLEEHGDELEDGLRTVLAASRITVSSVPLPAGRAVRADYQFYEPGSARASDGSHHVLVDDAARCYHLAFGGVTAPDDHWLSITETIEILPVEGM